MEVGTEVPHGQEAGVAVAASKHAQQRQRTKVRGDEVVKGQEKDRTWTKEWQDQCNGDQVGEECVLSSSDSG